MSFKKKRRSKKSVSKKRFRKSKKLSRKQNKKLNNKNNKKFTFKEMDKLMIKISKLSGENLDKYLKTENIDKLYELKEILDDKYYNTSETLFTDDQYDMLKESLMKRDKKFIDKVGARIREDDNRVKLPFWLGSVDKIKPEDSNKLAIWLKKNPLQEFIIESKLDGVSCLYIFKDGIANIFTRGDGVVGADISHLLPYLKNIPKNLKTNIAVRGELIIKESIFRDKYSDKFANSRNMVSGLVNSKTLKTGVVDLNFVAYEIIEDFAELKPTTQLEKLHHLGFEVVKNQIVNSINMENLSELLLLFKQNSEYEIDGIIVQPDVPYVRNVDKNPKYAFAFKMQLGTNLIEAEIEEVQWNISKHKLVKPRIRIKPVVLNGVTITYTSGFNAKYIVDNSIGKGTIIKLTRSGDVIPFIVEVVKSSSEPDMPDFNYTWNENNIDIIVSNDENNVSDIKTISSFFESMGIKHVSDKTVEKLYNAGFTSIVKICEGSASDFEKIEGFQKKLAEKIYDNIHNGLKNTTKDILLGSSSIFGEGLGKRKIKALLDGIPDIFKIYGKISETELINKITNIEGFSDKTALKLLKNIEKADEFLKSIDKFVTYKEIKENSADRVVKSFNNMSFLFSGFRDKNVEAEIVERGGEISGSVNKNLSVLVVLDKTKSSGKIDKAKKLGIPILEKDEFLGEYLE
jgi:NAD-dependent DNA ligase